LLAVVVSLGACGGVAELERPAYPQAPRGDQVDDYHGTRVADPYRWLEQLDSTRTRDWVDAQNAVSEAYLVDLPARASFAERMATLIDYERVGLPDEQGGVHVFDYNDGRMEQEVVRVSSDPTYLGRVVLDPNAMADDGSISIGDYELSPDGRYLAYSLSFGGSDWDSWRVMDLRNDRDLADRIDGTKFTGVAWLPDGSGFYYSRYPQVDDDFDDSQQVEVHVHRLGQDQSRDQLVYAVDDHPTRNPYADVTEDGRLLIIDLFDGYETNGVYVQRLDEQGLPTGDVQRLLDDWDARYDFLGNVDDTLYFQTTRDAPRGRILAVDLAGDWQEIVPESVEPIESAALLGGMLLVEYLADAHSRLRRFELDGTAMPDVELPGLGTLAELGGEADEPQAYLTYTDFTTPATNYRLDVASGRLELLFAPDSGIDPADYRTEQVFFNSRDGTRVPMYIVSRRDLPTDQPHPLVLYGYGGFNVSLLPGYSTARMAWLEAGGVYAVANLRGGGEYGEAWHRAGTRLNKQNVFDDFIAAAEWLIDERRTTPEQLAIWGGSNGGLLVGAVAEQRPELFAAAIPAVGVLDMLRYQLASANARQWSSDYGLSEDPQEFAALFAYSPYHRVAPGNCYPATLVMADANDDRVVPWHSYKYAAALQYAQSCDRPALIRIETNTGHGAGASTSKIIDEYADQWAFVAAMTGLEPE
jgi:prolyl oligopeptidase